MKLRTRPLPRKGKNASGVVAGHGRGGTIWIETNVVSGKIDVTALGENEVAFDGDGLGRRIAFSAAIAHGDGADTPVNMRVTQEDGRQGWSSPDYLID